VQRGFFSRAYLSYLFVQQPHKINLTNSDLNLTPGRMFKSWVAALSMASSFIPKKRDCATRVPTLAGPTAGMSILRHSDRRKRSERTIAANHNKGECKLLAAILIPATPIGAFAHTLYVVWLTANLAEAFISFANLSAGLRDARDAQRCRTAPRWPRSPVEKNGAI
jgi:hypothetical protein